MAPEGRVNSRDAGVATPTVIRAMVSTHLSSERNNNVSLPPLCKGIYTSQLEPNSNILPPPVVGEGWGGGGECRVTLATPILTFPHQGGRN
jgi:hypothetical protein